MYILTRPTSDILLCLNLQSNIARVLTKSANTSILSPVMFHCRSRYHPCEQQQISVLQDSAVTCRFSSMRLLTVFLCLHENASTPQKKYKAFVSIFLPLKSFLLYETFLPRVIMWLNLLRGVIVGERSQHASEFPALYSARKCSKVTKCFGA